MENLAHLSAIDAPNLDYGRSFRRASSARDSARNSLPEYWHTASGNHQSRRERFPIWVPSEVMKEAKALSVAEAESILSPWLSLVGKA